MASARTAEFLFLFDAIFVGFLVLYGQSNATLANYIAGPLNTLQAPFPDLQSLLVSQGYTGIKNCGLLDGNCQSQNVSQATIFVGSAIIWIGGLVFSILQKIGAAVYLIFGLTTTFGTDLGVPFLGYIFTAFLVMSLLYGFALIRGTSMGA